MTNETRTPSPHKCPSCKASFTDDGEFVAHMGGQCTPSPDVPGSVAGAVPSPALSSERLYGAGGDHASGSHSRHGEGTTDYDGIVEVDPADFDRELIDERGLLEARLTKLYAKLATVGKSYDAEAVADALTRIEAQSATIARLNAEVERTGDVEYAAEFLCARVRELEGDMVDGPVADQFYGHVLTALARMDAALAPKEG